MNDQQTKPDALAEETSLVDWGCCDEHWTVFPLGDQYPVDIGKAFADDINRREPDPWFYVVTQVLSEQELAK